jgi:hypothetical protein
MFLICEGVEACPPRHGPVMFESQSTEFTNDVVWYVALSHVTILLPDQFWFAQVLSPDTGR